jgi:hypothetical protein
MLDRFRVSDGRLEPLAPLNVPGYPIALAASGSLLFSAEPDAMVPGAAKLHMLSLDVQGAHALHSLALDARFSQLQAALGKGFYVRRAGQGCAGTSHVGAISLPDDSSRAPALLGELELAGASYEIADAADGMLLLADNAGHYVVLDVSGDAAPRLLTFASAANTLWHPQLAGRHVIGTSTLSPDSDIAF